MDTTGVVYFPSQFGIKRHQDKDGQVEWIIEVVTDEAAAHTQSARYDVHHGVWILQQTPKQQLSGTETARERENEESPHVRSGMEWTSVFPTSPFTDLFLNFDWGATSIGPLDKWPRSLRSYTQMLLSDVRPAWIYWGPERIAIYNEASIHVVGALHPQLMGRAFEKVMPNLWEIFGPMFQALKDGEHGFARNGIELPSRRNGHMEETYWDGGLTALRDDNGQYGGAFFSWTEVTRMTLRDRRTTMINRLGNSSLTTANSFWQHVHDILQEYPRDVPMAIMYSVDEDHTSDGLLHREHTIGLGAAYAAAPSDLNLAANGQETVISSLLRRVQEASENFIFVDLAKEKAYTTIIESVDWLGFGEPSRHLAVIALKDRSLFKGYILLGLNPRTDLDGDHKQFLTELARQLNDTLIRAIFRKELRDREEVLVTELSETQKRASRMAEVVPVGIYEIAADGTLHWANNQFFEIMGVHGERRKESFRWTDHVHPDDYERANEQMTKCLLQGVEICDTSRLRKEWTPPGSEIGQQSTSEPFWVMYSASPNLDADSSMPSLTGSVTDISHLKWAEQLQFRNAEAAQKERRVQEEFIDITSHEMRNPLSAITQAADGILLSLHESMGLEDVESTKEIIRLNAEAAESILFCAAHQRRIIDDILTLGKLDSKLLTVFPARFRLEDLLDQTMQMFKAEFEANKIEIHTTVTSAPANAMCSMRRCTEVQGDASRILQVLVNLVTNAIKFTKTQPTRKFNISCGSSFAPPPPDLFGQNFQWHCTNLPRPDLTQDPEYGDGHPVYIHFAVTDSGEGIPPSALEKIFTKFTQADRRTHTKYGGSGLGLYISRELTELQGGCVGIESAVGIGSTFAFYTKAKCCGTSQAHAAQTTPSPTSPQHPLVPLGNPSSPILLHGYTKPLPPTSRCTYNILLVEDNVLNQTVLAKQLRRAGCSVQVSSNGGEAVDTILRKLNQPPQFNTLPSDDPLPYYDCILMDWEMPVCDGIQATKMIRKIEAQQDVSGSLIIGVTANARAEQVQKARDAGMDGVVPKPFRVAELLAKIADFLGPG
ncbi:Histidine kinase [Curvularia kusanoi]|uniref:Histidine kinase n=1 Tax=Curvularia kusanoi TaxID=90978 RepID=A0A9P4W3P7_CURKU|nr:Histidine kinase [Curvularia kusanoi]